MKNVKCEYVFLSINMYFNYINRIKFYSYVIYITFYKNKINLINSLNLLNELYKYYPLIYVINMHMQKNIIEIKTINIK